MKFLKMENVIIFSYFDILAFIASSTFVYIFHCCWGQIKASKKNHDSFISLFKSFFSKQMITKIFMAFVLKNFCYECTKFEYGEDIENELFLEFCSLLILLDFVFLIQKSFVPLYTFILFIIWLVLSIVLLLTSFVQNFFPEYQESLPQWINDYFPPNYFPHAFPWTFNSLCLYLIIHSFFDFPTVSKLGYFSIFVCFSFSIILNRSLFTHYEMDKFDHNKCNVNAFFEKLFSWRDWILPLIVASFLSDVKHTDHLSAISFMIMFIPLSFFRKKLSKYDDVSFYLSNDISSLFKILVIIKVFLCRNENIQLFVAFALFLNVGYSYFNE